MGTDDGLSFFQEGRCLDRTLRPLPEYASIIDGRHLWVVRESDMVNAEEKCEFGAKLPRGVIKHTNLTGGASAFVGGELLFLAEGLLIVNGRSGRYGPRTSEEMELVEQAFKNSGYGVWSMGYDEETDQPFAFNVVDPKWVE